MSMSDALERRRCPRCPIVTGAMPQLPRWHWFPRPAAAARTVQHGLWATQPRPLPLLGCTGSPWGGFLAPTIPCDGDLGWLRAASVRGAVLGEQAMALAMSGSSGARGAWTAASYYACDEGQQRCAGCVGPHQASTLVQRGSCAHGACVTACMGRKKEKK